jgi:hypothetical protein
MEHYKNSNCGNNIHHNKYCIVAICIYCNEIPFMLPVAIGRMVWKKINIASNVVLQQFFGKLPHFPRSCMHLMPVASQASTPVWYADGLAVIIDRDSVWWSRIHIFTPTVILCRRLRYTVGVSLYADGFRYATDTSKELMWDMPTAAVDTGIHRWHFWLCWHFWPLLLVFYMNLPRH